MIKIKKQVTNSRVVHAGCSIIIKPHFNYDLSPMSIDRAIWLNNDDYEDCLQEKVVGKDEENKEVKADVARNSGTINSLDQVRSFYTIDPTECPEDVEGSEAVTLFEKFLQWVEEKVVEQILKDNPTWSKSDIEII